MIVSPSGHGISLPPAQAAHARAIVWFAKTGESGLAVEAPGGKPPGSCGPASASAAALAWLSARYRLSLIRI